jgi:5,10-methylenetetrahydrofolate reductase
MTTLRAKNKNHIFTITAELDPPKSASSEITEKQVAEIADYVDAVNIADCPMAKLRMSPIALSSIIQQKYCVESIFHLTRPQHNRASGRTPGGLCPWRTQYPHFDRRSALHWRSSGCHRRI